MIRNDGSFERVVSAALLVLAVASCGGRAEGSATNRNEPLATAALPFEGIPNQNGFVGPFCCTGVTGVFKDANGAPMGYAYFYTFENGLLLSEDRSVASALSVLVAGRSDLAAADSPLTREQVNFEASELRVGATKSVVAGALEFEVIIDDVDIVRLDSGEYFEMGTIAASVAVRAAPSSTP